MINKKDINYFRTKLSKKEVNEILGRYQVMLNYPECKREGDLLTRNNNNGLSTADIKDIKISILAMLSVMFKVFYWESHEKGNELLSDKYKRICFAICDYIVLNGTKTDIDIYVKMIEKQYN